MEGLEAHDPAMTYGLKFVFSLSLYSKAELSVFEPSFSGATTI